MGFKFLVHLEDKFYLLITEDITNRKEEKAEQNTERGTGQ